MANMGGKLQVDNAFALLAFFLSPWKGKKTQDSLCRLISGNKIHWDSLVYQANLQMCIPLWFSCLKQDGLLGLLPADLQEYLEHLYELNVERNEFFFEALQEMLGLFEKNSINSILLKGGAAFSDGLYGNGGARFVQDIDIMVPEADAERAGQILQGCGYVEIPDPGKELDNLPTDKRHHHINGLHKPETPVVIEIHYRIGYARMGGILSKEDAWGNTTALPFRGQNVLVLDPTTRLIHNTIHAVIGEADFIRGHLPLSQLAEFAFLSQKYWPEIDFRKWYATCDSGGVDTEAATYLLLAHRLMGMPLPDGIPVSWRARFHAARLTAAGRFSARHKDIPESRRDKVLGTLVRGLVKCYYFISLPVWIWQNVCYTGNQGQVWVRLRLLLRKVFSLRSWGKV